MQSLQEIFNQIQEVKKKQKDLRLSISDALAASSQLKEVQGKIKELNAKKKDLERAIKADFASEITKLDDLQVDLESFNTLLSDAILTLMLKGEKVEIVDSFGNALEPELVAKLVKA